MLTSALGRTSWPLSARDAGLDHLVDIRYGDFHAPEAGDASFDVVWTQEALLHGAGKPAILSECHRVVRKGGGS